MVVTVNTTTSDHLSLILHDVIYWKYLLKVCDCCMFAKKIFTAYFYPYNQENS